MSEKGFMSTNWFKISIIALMVTVIGLYLQREHQLDACLNSVEEGFQKQIDEACIKSKLKPGCNSSENFIRLLNGEIAFTVASLAQRRETETNQCFRRYGIK